MHHRTRSLAVAVLIAAAVTLIGAEAAQADGLPVVDLDTSRTGIASPETGSRYYALPAQGRTQLIELRPDQGSDLQTMNRRGTLAVPGVAFDGTTSGLSADGRTLVLIEPRQAFPRRNTRLLVVDTERWKVFDRIELAGDFSFDAVSPDGSAIYFIHYVDPRDPTKYEVRAYDTVPGKLRAEPVIDARTAPKVMRGYPMTRVSSPDGVWEYTLYDGGGGTPFVHALNTEQATAFCIDVPQLADANNLTKAGLDVSADGALISVLFGRDPQSVAEISSGSWEIRDPRSAVVADEGGGFSAWWVLPLAGLGLLIVGLIGLRTRRHRIDPPDDPLPDLPGPGDAEQRPEEQGQPAV